MARASMINSTSAVTSDAIFEDLSYRSIPPSRLNTFLNLFFPAIGRSLLPVTYSIDLRRSNWNI